MTDESYNDLNERLSAQVAELRERIHLATSDTKEYALQKSERARNSAIGVLGFVALVFGISGYLGLDIVVQSELEALGSDAVLEAAADATARAEEAATRVEALEAQASQDAAAIAELAIRAQEAFDSRPVRLHRMVTATERVDLAETGWRDVPGMVTQFEGDGAFLILFQASGVQSAAVDNAVLFRLLVDDRPVALSRHEFKTVGWALRDVGLQSVETLEAGSHTVRVQWAGGYAGKTIQMSRYQDTRSLIVIQQ